MDHLGAGREWDLTRKRGGLNIVPPFAERSVKLYSGRVDALDSILNWLEAQKELELLIKIFILVILRNIHPPMSYQNLNRIYLPILKHGVISNQPWLVTLVTTITKTIFLNVFTIFLHLQQII